MMEDNTEKFSWAKELYPDDESSFYDYDRIIQSFGEVAIQIDEGSYSGDTIALLKSGDNYGILFFGWGSCSGCDALAACSSYEEVNELIEELRASIKWDTFPNLVKYVNDDETRSGSYYYSESIWAEFKEEFNALAQELTA